jgi:hypothetical protein
VLVFRILDNDGVFARKANWLERKASGEWMLARINLTREVVDIQLVRNPGRRNLADVPVWNCRPHWERPARDVTAKEPVVRSPSCPHHQLQQ